MTRSWTDELERLPPGLSGDDVRVVIAEQADLVAWPDTATFVPADLPARLATLVQRAWHREIEGARIAHLYRQKLTGRGDCETGAKVQRPGPLWIHLARVDFVVIYNFEVWLSLPLVGRLALIDHELSHCGRDPDIGWVTVPHDLSEFGTVVRRWGPWHDGIRRFRDQLDLFSGRQSPMAAAGPSGPADSPPDSQSPGLTVEDGGAPPAPTRRGPNKKGRK